jgi:branched-chain amino acid transport system permease protein
MQTKPLTPWKGAIQSGLIGGAIAVLLSLVGMVATFGERNIVSGWFTMGQVLFLAPILILAYGAVRKISPQPVGTTLLVGAISGLVGSGLLAILVLLGRTINLRVMFANAAPELYEILTFGQSSFLGILVLLLICTILGTLTAALFLLPDRVRHAIIQALVWVIVIGLLRDLIMTVVNQWTNKAKAFPPSLAWARAILGFISTIFTRVIFAASGLRPLSAIILFLLVGAIQYRRYGKKREQFISFAAGQPWDSRRVLKLALIVIIFLLLPQVLGIFFAEILDNVSLYILMGLGLNIVVGFAGLLDLGYVAFYAIGAYTMGVLTSPELGFASLTWWQALPFALVAAFLAGVILGLPVLKMRGDYLAIVTLGFGEIVRLLALSDWLAPWLGGTQGIQRIAQPSVGNFVINTQQELYYLFLIGLGIVAFVAWRVKDSRIGRAWMALREDEDVAMAMGINHVTTKLMAFATGALFSGLAGTIFAAKLQSVYPHSMNFLVSINVLSLIIIGGMGSIPGVFVGGLALIAAPELLREFAEYRYLVYGAVLVVMMLTRPEGLWPEERRKLELHEEEEVGLAAEVQPPPPVLKTPSIQE